MKVTVKYCSRPGEDVEQLELSCAGGTVGHSTAAWATAGQLSVRGRYHPAVPLLVTDPREMKTCGLTKTRVWVFTAALFIVAQTRNQVRCPSGEQNITEQETGGDRCCVQERESLTEQKKATH